MKTLLLILCVGDPLHRQTYHRVLRPNSIRAIDQNNTLKFLPLTIHPDAKKVPHQPLKQKNPANAGF